jgi:hypothetical protein
MKKSIELTAIADQELESIIKSAWSDNASISVNLKMVASMAILYGQRRLIAEGWQEAARR